LDDKQLRRLGELTKLDFLGRMKTHERSERAQISFERPWLSPCLERITDKNSPQFKEALAIIAAGARMLKSRPRCDMDNFTPCDKDLERLRLFDQRERIERQFRDKIRTGARLYDKDVSAP
jgi:hypothetical protein